MVALLLAVSVFSAEPRRIVSTAPGITEALYALGLGDRVAGVTTFCRYPPEAARKPKVGTYTQPDIEVIALLRPDLVVIQKNPIRLEERLRAMGLKVIEVSFDSIAGIHGAIRALGEAAGVRDRAAALNARIDADLDAVRARVSRLPAAKVLFVVGRTPGLLENLVTVSRGSYLDEVLTIAGGRNIFSDARTAYPKVTLEEVLARGPEVIIDMGDMARTGRATVEQKRAAAAPWGRYPVIPAVRERRVFTVADDIFVVPGPRVVEAAREFARMIHPEAGR